MLARSAAITPLTSAMISPRPSPERSSAPKSRPASGVSIQGVFGTLASGAALVVVDEETRRDAALLAESLNRHGVQRVHMAYTAVKSFIEHRPRIPTLR